MVHDYEPISDEDLTPRFRWRWREHGIYLAVCSIIGLFVLGLQTVPMPPKPQLNPTILELIQVRYLTAADEPPAKDEPFHDPRLVHLSPKQVRLAM